MTEGMVDCPGCLKEFDPVQMNGAFVKVEIGRMNPNEASSSLTFYCPSCTKKVQEMDESELLDTLEVIVRGRLKEMK